MKKLFSRMVWVLALLALSFSAAAQAEKTAEEIAAELLELSGAGEMGVQVAQQLLASYKTNMPDVPAEFWDDFGKEIDPTELEQMVIPIYVEHLTKEEMEAAIAFYKTPEGSAILRKMPVILQESMAVGQQWGMKLASKIQKRLTEANDEN